MPKIGCIGQWPGRPGQVAIIMVRLIRSHLQVRLIMAFVLVMLIPTTLVSAYNLLRTREILLSQISSEQLRIAEARASTAESRIAQGSGDLLFVVMSAALRRYAHVETRDPDLVATTFQDFLRQSVGRYSGLCLLNPKGVEEVCVRQGDDNLFRRVPTAQLRNQQAEPVFVNALRQAGIPDGNMVAITTVDLTGTPSILLRYSILYADDTGPVGVLVLEAPLAPILSVLVDQTLGVRTSVLDSDGTYLYRSDLDLANARRLSLTEAQPHDAQIILRQAEGTIIESVDRPASFQAFKRMRPHSQSAVQWTVIYEHPYAAALAPVGETQVVITALTILALVSATALAYMLARGIIRPIRALAVAAEQIGAGKLNTAVPHAGLDEIGALGRTLEHTVVRLRETLTAAEVGRNEAETLRAATQALGVTLNLDQVLALILTELRKMVPFDSASVQEVQGEKSRIVGTYGSASSEHMLGLAFPLVPGETPNAEVAHTWLPVILKDGPAVYPIFKTEPFHADPIRSWLGVPMIFGERMIGMITLNKYTPDFYTTEHARLAMAFAAQATAAMENARLYAAARRELAERHRAEEAQARLAAIIEATTDMVGMTDLQGQSIFLNQAGRRLMGLSDEVPLAGLHMAEFFPMRLRGALRDEILPATLHNGVWTGDTYLLARDGSEIPVSQVIIVHKEPDGQAALFSTIVRDMRVQRQTEEDLRQAQKMEALGRLAGGMAHDFNNLLTVMLGEVELLLDDLPVEHPLRHSAEQIRLSGTRAATLTRQLLTFSRRQVLQPELVNLNQVILGLDQLLRRLISEDITLSISLAPDLPLVRTDQGQIEQVVMNLVINARDAMPDGGHLLIETATTLANELSGRRDDGTDTRDYALIVVSDTGTGMDEQTKTHIFEPFFTTKPRGKGTGLGLATVHGIVQQSGGHIRFQSEVGQGAIFKIYLPITTDAGPNQAQPPAPARLGVVGPSRTHAATVLLVEDDDDVRNLARQILTRQGFTVLEAGDGPTALALAHAYAGPISTLLTDIVMPGGLNGVQLAATLRTLRPNTRIIYMSGYTDNALVDHSIAEEGACFLQKPFTPDKLVRALLDGLD